MSTRTSSPGSSMRQPGSSSICSVAKTTAACAASAAERTLTVPAGLRLPIAGPFNGVRGTLEVAWRGAYNAPRTWFAIRSNFTSFATHEQPSYALVNARVSYDLGRTRPIRLSLIGTNLLDKRPEETLVGGMNRLAGRAIFGEVEVHF